jgi:streptogramin lyase
MARFVHSVAAGLCVLALSSCGSNRALGPLPGDAGSSAARYVAPKAFQQNNGAQFVEYSTQCSVPLGQVSHGTTSDSMWFTIPKGCKKNPGAVARVEIGTGQITEFTVGKSASPLVIAENAGYVWAADQNRLKTGSRPIYRFNEDGTYTTFVLPSAIVVNSMTAGPDGNLWFSGVYQNKKVVEGGYGFVTPSGASTLYSLPGNPTPQLVSITSGSDGNLWIADENGAIDKVAPSNGALTTYSVGGHPYAITSSSNVQVYSDSSAAQLSTIDRNGKFTVYPAPQGEHPAFLARKTDGSVLFVKPRNGRTHWNPPGRKSPQPAPTASVR